MGWIFLLSAIFLEVLGTVSLKLCDGFSKAYPSILMILFYTLSVIAFAYAIKKMDVGLAYALWSGLGTLVIATIGILYFNEPSDAVKITSIGLIAIGVVGLNMGTTH